MVLRLPSTLKVRQRPLGLHDELSVEPPTYWGSRSKKAMAGGTGVCLIFPTCPTKLSNLSSLQTLDKLDKLMAKLPKTRVYPCLIYPDLLDQVPVTMCRSDKALTPACAGFFVLRGSVLIELHPPPSHGHGVGVHCGLFHQRPPVTPL